MSNVTAEKIVPNKSSVKLLYFKKGTAENEANCKANENI